jgi:hypothetical protein
MTTDMKGLQRMTRQILSALALASIAFASSSAFASKARLSALGQGATLYTDINDGSLYLDDTRNVFLNPAYLNRVTDFANFELGTTTPTAGSPNAEGGYFSTTGPIRYGLQLGSLGEAVRGIANANTAFGVAAANTLTTPNNTVQAVVGGGGGTMKWGAAVLYGSGENRTTAAGVTTGTKSNTLEVKAGLSEDVWQAYVHFLVMAKAENETAAATIAKYEGKPSLRLGGSYNLNADEKVTANLAWLNYTGHPETSTTDIDVAAMGIQANYVRFVSGSDAALRFFYTAGLGMENYTVKTPTEAKNDKLFIPLLIGLENSVNDWLTLRASVGQKVFLDQFKTASDTNNAPANTTTVGAGAGIKWAKFTLDATLEGAAGAAAANTGRINGNSLLANVGMTYMF